MLRPLILAVSMMLCSPAGAASIYKCVSGGKVTYSGTLCAKGSMQEMRIKDGPPAMVHPAPRVHPEQARAKEREPAPRQRGNAAAAAHARRCAKLQLAQKRADAKVDAALSSEREQMRTKARQHRETMAIECPA